MTTDASASSFSNEPDRSAGEWVEGMQPERRGRGCVFWGCLTAVVLLLLVGGCTGFCACSVWNFLMDHSEEEPMELPTIEPPPEELSALSGRYAEFVRIADQGGGELVLTADDLNRRIAASDGNLGGVLWVRIEADLIFLDVSLPLEEVFGQSFDGRYINGTVGAGLTMKDDEVEVVLESVKTRRGKELSKEQLDQASEVLSSDPQTREHIDGIFGEAGRRAKSLEIRDGKLIFRN